MAERTSMQEPREDRQGWVGGFLRELVTMPRRHALVFFVATVLLVIVEVELLEGWHLVHLAELVGAMVFLYLLWAAWRVRRGRRSG